MLQHPPTPHLKKGLLFGGVLLFLLGIGIGYLLPGEASFSVDQDLITREGGYELINPLLSCDINEDTPYAEFNPLKNKLADVIVAAKNKGDITRASVYFRDLDFGRWTGANENDTYVPASLIKIPVLIGYLYDARNNSDLLTTTLTYSGKSDETITQDIKPAHPLRPGTYSINSLLESMIQESDNNAYAVLNDHISTSTLEKVYSNFGVPPPENASDEQASPKLYSRFFRILYNSSFLGRVRSQTALTILSKTTFTSGIVSGVAEKTTVAHKYGERTVKDASGNILTRELHDCGIVYAQHHPYLLCIMTEGRDYSKMESTIADLSRTTWSAVAEGLLEKTDGRE